MNLRKLILLTSAVIALGALGACAKKEAVPVESTAIETVQETEDPYSLGDKDVTVEQPTEIVGTLADSSATLATTPDGETQVDFGIYGPLGKEFYDTIAEQWINWTIEDETTLRSIMDDVYQELPSKETLTSQILALARNQNPYEVALESTKAQQESEAVEAATPTPAPTPKQHSSNPAPIPTQPVSQPKETQPAPDPTPAPQPQETQPAPTPAPNANPSAPHGTTPGGIPLTGNPEIDAAIQASENNTHTGGASVPTYDLDEAIGDFEFN